MPESCSDAVARALRSRGVERVYGIPGGETVHLVDSLLAHGIDLVVTRHENSAAFMGLTGARHDGRPGVCMTTIGPGASNIVMGAGTATLDFSPLLVISGELPAAERGHPRKQKVPQRELFNTVCKGSYELTENGPDACCLQALDLATAERPGAVHLSLPADLAAKPSTPHSYRPEPIEEPASELIAAEGMLAGAERPVALLGAGVLRSAAGEAARRFVSSNSIPALHTWQGAGTVPFQDPLCLGNVGLPCHRAPMRALAEADLVVTVGYDEQEFQPSIWDPEGEKSVLHLSANPPQDVPCYRPRAAVGDLNHILSSLSPARRGGEWAAHLREEVVKHMERTVPSERGMDPLSILRALDSFMGDDDVLVSDVGAHMLWIAEHLPCRREGQVLLSNGMIPMGIGLPGAMGVKFSSPDKNCITVTGDAGLMMCLGELQTAIEHDVPVTVMVWNDAALGLIETRHELALGGCEAYRLGRNDMAKVAESLGATGLSVERASQLPAALEEGRRNDLPTVIDMAVDYSRNRDLLV